MAHKSHGVKAKKHLGQHFLNDESVALRIVESIQSVQQGSNLLEIGPGTGALTRHLVHRFGQAVLALEVDKESVAFLKEAPWIESNQVVQADFLAMKESELAPSGNIIVAGNFPYNISSQILFKFLDWRERGTELVGMFQKEVAERICAPHGSKTYGILSVLVQTFYHAEYLFTVPPHVFTPPPKVQSGVLRLTQKTESTDHINYAHLKRITKAAFNQRRKTLRNALKSGGLIIDGVHPDFLGLRAEQLSPGQFLQLADSIPTG
mgnify:CR=1 FL=1